LPQYCGRPGCVDCEAVVENWRYLDGNSLHGLDRLQQKLARRALNKNNHWRCGQGSHTFYPNSAGMPVNPASLFENDTEPFQMRQRRGRSFQCATAETMQEERFEAPLDNSIDANSGRAQTNSTVPWTLHADFHAAEQHVRASGTYSEELACAAYEGFDRGNERPLANPTLELSALKKLAGYWHDTCGPVAFVRGCSFIVFPNEDEVHFSLRFTLPKAFPGGRQAPRGHIEAELFGKPWRAVFSMRSEPLLQIHWNSGDVWRKVDYELHNPAT